MRRTNSYRKRDMKISWVLEIIIRSYALRKHVLKNQIYKRWNKKSWYTILLLYYKIIIFLKHLFLEWCHALASFIFLTDSSVIYLNCRQLLLNNIPVFLICFMAVRVFSTDVVSIAIFLVPFELLYYEIVSTESLFVLQNVFKMCLFF